MTETHLTDVLEIPRWIMKDFQFKDSQLLVYSLFYQFKGKPLCVKTVSETLCLTRSTVQSAIRQLRGKGYLNTYFRDKCIKWYTINMDFIPEKYR